MKLPRLLLQARRRWPLRAFLLVLMVLATIRALLPVLLRPYVTSVLTRGANLRCSIERVDLNLWRGAFELEGVRLEQVLDGESLPFAEAQRLDLSLQWAGLWRGRLVCELELHHPCLWFRDSFEAQSGKETPESAPPGEGGGDVPGSDGPESEAWGWSERLDALFPFRIERLAMRDGELRFESSATDPQTDLYMTDVYLELLNLTNIRDRDSEDVLLAEAELAGRPLGTGEFECRMRFDPLARLPRFELDAALRKVPLTDLNDFLRAYGSVDAERGVLAVFAEFAVSDGEVDGYVKALLEDVQLLRFREIESPGDALEALWEGFVDLGAEVFENQPRDRLAARIPVRGKFSSSEADLMSAVGSVLRNAFVMALRPALDESIELRDLDVEVEGAGAQGEAEEGGEG